MLWWWMHPVSVAVAVQLLYMCVAHPAGVAAMLVKAAHKSSMDPHVPCMNAAFMQLHVC